MTAHAMDRIAMRMPGLDPARALADIRAAHRAGTLVKVADSCDPTKRVCHWPAPGGKHLFPVVTDKGEVVTVLTEGMEALTPTGRVVLSAPVVEGEPNRWNSELQTDYRAPEEWLGPGVYDIDAEIYHSDPCEEPSLSAGLAATMLDATPLHAFAASPRLNPDYERVDKTLFDIGSACHEILTGKGRGIHVVDADDYKKKAAQAERDEAREAGLTPLTRPQNDQVQRMVKLARIQMEAHGIGNPFATGRNELTLIWKQDGVMNRIMVDCVDEANRVAYDLKTCAGVADPNRWIRRSMDHGVDARAAHYLDGLKASFGGE